MRRYCNGIDSEKGIEITYLNVGGTDHSAELGRMCAEAEGLSVGFEAFDSEETVRDAAEFRELQRSARGCDIMLMIMHGDVSGYRRFDALRSVLSGEGVNAFLLCQIEESVMENRPLFKGTDADFMALRRYVQLGGSENRRGMLAWIFRNIGGADMSAPEPVRSRAQGIYHPDFPRDVAPEEYYPSLDPGKPTVGLLFSHGAWLDGALEPYDLLIREVEGMGANVIPVFHMATPSEVTGSIGAARAVETYFKRDGKSIVGSLISPAGFSQIALANPTDGSGPRGGFNFYMGLDAPSLQAIPLFRPQSEWEADGIGMEGGELAICVALPELDGLITTVPFVFCERDADGSRHHSWRMDRIRRIAGMAVMWARVGMVPASERKVSILVNGSGAGLGTAGGLDSFESIRNILEAMSAAGYAIDRVPSSGQEIIDEMAASLTNDLEWKDDRDIEEQAEDMVGMDRYRGWLGSVPAATRESMCRCWGDPPGQVMSHKGALIIPGVRNGNVYLGMEPVRGKHEKAEEMIHDPHVAMPHQYLAYYRWMAEEFGSDIHVHVGTHGSAEWLPGKGNALSEECSPDVVMGHIPNLYVYVIDDPSEGIVAKRRKNSVLVDHMMPSMTRAGVYDDLAGLEASIHDYLFCRSTFQRDKLPGIAADVRERIGALGMWKEVGLEEGAPAEDVTERIETVYDYVSDLKDALITDGLHVLGRVPEGRHMEEMVYCLTRLRNGGVPSLRGAVAESMGFDLDALLDAPSQTDGATGEVNGAIIDRIDGKAWELIRAMQERGYDPGERMRIAGEICPGGGGGISLATEFICGSVHPGIRGMTQETSNLIAGMRGDTSPRARRGRPRAGTRTSCPRAGTTTPWTRRRCPAPPAGRGESRWPTS